MIVHSPSLLVLLAPLGLVTGSAALAGQPITALQPADATPFSEPFSLLNGARELPDGRLVVTDWAEQRLVVLDVERGSAREVGGRGGGPGEFRLPGGLLAFRGDSTILIDRGNERLAVLDAEGVIRRTLRVTLPGTGTPGGADDDGRLYYVQPGWAIGLPPGSTDPRPLARWDPATDEVLEIARVDVARPRSDAGRPRTTPGIPFVMFAARDAWVVAPSGAVAIVRSSPYRVEWLRDGERSVGPTLPSDPPPVTDADRTAFVRRFLERAPISGRGPDGGLGPNPAVSDEEVRRMVDTNEFAERHPPFDPAGVTLGVDGRLWVRTSPSTRDPAVFDVLGGDGALLARVALPPGRRLLAVGARHLYAVTRDELDLETLERYEIPALP